MKLSHFLPKLLASISYCLPLALADTPQQQTVHNLNGISLSVREYWMQRAIDALDEVVHSPCPFAAFGSVIVNHTSRDDKGQLVCIGANSLSLTGDPVLHGETAAITNCTKVLSSPPYSLKPSQILAAWKDLSLYTTAEPCPMCSSAIAWSPFAEYIYATGMDKLIELGWDQPKLSSREVIAHFSTGNKINVIGGVLTDKTDPLFAWQYKNGSCPNGCVSTGKNKCKFRPLGHVDEL